MKRLTVEISSDPEQGGFTARVPDIPAYGEGETEEEAIADLREALRGYIEAFGIEDAEFLAPVGSGTARLGPCLSFLGPPARRWSDSWSR